MDCHNTREQEQTRSGTSKRTHVGVLTRIQRDDRLRQQQRTTLCSDTAALREVIKPGLQPTCFSPLFTMLHCKQEHIQPETETEQGNCTRDTLMENWDPDPNNCAWKACSEVSSQGTRAPSVPNAAVISLAPGVPAMSVFRSIGNPCHECDDDASR